MADKQTDAVHFILALSPNADSDTADLERALDALPCRWRETALGVYWLESKSPLHAYDLENLPGVAFARCLDKPLGLSEKRRDGEDSRVRIAELSTGAGDLLLAAGPCAVESAAQIHETAGVLAQSGVRLLRGGAFKPRTRISSFQGLGIEGLRVLHAAARANNMLTVSEILSTEQLDLAWDYVDVVQVGMRNMQHFPLLTELGRRDKPVLLKRHVGARIGEWLAAADYILEGGNERVILCERGSRNFGGGAHIGLDIADLLRVKARTHLPVWVDPSHALGDRRLVPAAAMAALAAGADGLLIEVHPSPQHALSDGPQQVALAQWPQLHGRLSHLAKSLGRTLR